MSRLATLLLVLATLVLPGQAQFSFPSAKSANSSEAHLTSEASSIAPGVTFTVALQLKHPEGWHSYYKNSGGVEKPPAINWTLPPGFTAGPIQWPVPEIKDGYFGKSFVYPGSPVFLVDLTAPATIKPGERVKMTATATWQICKESCIDETKTFTLDLPVTAASTLDPAQATAFSAARAKLPSSEDRVAAWSATSESAGADIKLRLTPKSGAAALLDPAKVDFVPNQSFVKSLRAGGEVKREGTDWVVTLKRNTIDYLDNPIPQGNTVSGIFVNPDGTPALAVPETRLAAPPVPPLPLSKYLPILGGMLLGGLILNLMPCVFPVIGLKIMGFVQQAGHERAKIVGHGITFALGVLASFGVISGILFAARVASGGSGEPKGWGYQLQDPWVVLILMLLMFVLALNMFGLFELGTSATSVGGSLQRKEGLAGSFFSGVLATVVATPCSAPFLGAAIGVAVTLPALQFFTAFGAMAVGLALPYLILSIFPALVNFLPRPGVWMETFKQAMAFPLFATAGFLLWVYAGQIGLENLLGPVFGLSAIAVAAWVYGRWFPPHRTRRARTLAVAFTVVFAAAGLYLTKPPKPSSIAWEPWSQEKVDAALKDGHPVYIDFTAQWCATCQVNKKVAYGPEIAALIKEKGIITFKADKTSPNPAIEAKLRELNRTAIPVNVLVVPGKEPIVTPELLSAGYLESLFTKEIPSSGT